MKKAVFFVSIIFVLMLITDVSTQPSGARRYINLPGHPQLPFSDGVLVGDTLYLSGRLGLDPKTGTPPEDPEQEIRDILDGMKATLKESGMTMDDLVFVQVFCTDLSFYEKFNAIYVSYFSKDFPARAFLGTARLLRGCHFEVQGIAVRR